MMCFGFKYIKIPVWVLASSGSTLIFDNPREDILGKWGQFGHCLFKGLFEDSKKLLY